LRVERAVPVRDRRRLEHRRDGEPRHRPHDALQAARGASARDEADLDEGRRRVPWEVRELRSDLDVAEAGTEAPPASPPRRRERSHAATGRGLLRRLVPPWACGRRARHGARGPARAGRPLVVPVCYAFDGHACFSAIDAKPKRVAARALRRVRNIEQNPQVSLVVDRYDEDWARLCWVIVEGRADLLTEGPVRAT